MAKVPSIGQILRPFTGYGDVSIWGKILEWDKKIGLKYVIYRKVWKNLLFANQRNLIRRLICRKKNPQHI